MDRLDNISDFLFYNGPDGSIRVEVIVDNENGTVWTTQSSMAEIFDTTKQNISYHIGNVLKEGELDEIPTVKEILTVQKEGNREVNRPVQVYNLDMIISVGYRVSSYNAVQFRIWATKILKEYLIKGFALDDDRLKQGNRLFDKDHFAELLERIREIRASERLFYQKITDLYRLSEDYDKNSPITKDFFAAVQNKLHWAIHHHTAAELIKLRANAKAPNMGLTSWGAAKKGGKIIKSDIKIAKNYLTKDEMDGLNRLVAMYLDYAENLVKRQIVMKMKDWASRLDLFLQFNEYDLLSDAGKVKAEVACKLAEKEYEKFRVIQDREYKSDFDEVVEAAKKGKLPKESALNTPRANKVLKIDDLQKMLDEDVEKLSTHNQKLKQALNYNPKDKGE